MNFTRQFSALLRMNLTAIPQRLGLVLTIVIGVACAVGVLVSMLAMGVGARREAMGNVRSDRVILTSIGAPSALQSSIGKDLLPLIYDLPGIRRNAAGRPMAAAQALLFTQARKKETGGPMGFALTGVTAGHADVQPELHLTAGRMFQSGLHELIASNKCARQFSNFAVGDKRAMRGTEWLVVGNFDLGSSEGACVVIADAETLLSAFRIAAYNQVIVLLQSPEAFSQLTDALEADPTLRVEAKREAEVAERNMKRFNGMLNFVAYFIGAIMAVAATIGAANSLYAIVDSRRRELATLCALGFTPGPIITSILAESILLALPGAFIGVGLAWLLFNGFTASPFGFSFQLAVTAPIAGLGIAWALGMGLVGGLLPALKAARMPVTTALRAS
ncbi:ABC transporter permease [Steroidobacter cummioxidans]|uniref:ABC transporter permease n=1 Tax=Steroidobacter cummioxidans TaxID=1803913 RepID=UPI000E31D038|nr:ABC transporter permease [Steroidobacter cummioxidans]